MIEPILIAVVSAALYALVGYAKSVGEEPDLAKAGATMILGAVIGVLMAASGIDVTQINVTEQMVIYVGLVAVIENAIKAIVRRYKEWVQ